MPLPPEEKMMDVARDKQTRRIGGVSPSLAGS